MPNNSNNSPPKYGRRLYRKLLQSSYYSFVSMIEYSLFRSFQQSLRCFPSHCCRSIGEQIGTVFQQLSSRKQYVCKRNLQFACREQVTDQQIQTLTNRIFSFWGTALVEMLWSLEKITVNNWTSYFSVEGSEIIKSCARQNTGAIIAAPHMGMFEWIGQILAMNSFDVGGIAKKHNNKYFDRYLSNWRTQHNAKLFYVDDSYHQSKSFLEDGNLLILICDQYAGQDGIFTPFFGKRASHHPGPALLSKSTGAPIVPTTCFRAPDTFYYTVQFTSPLTPSSVSSCSSYLKPITHLLFSRFEQFIQSHPEQWLWFHRKWREKYFRNTEKNKN